MLFFSDKFAFLWFLVLLSPMVLLFGGCNDQNMGKILSQVENSNETLDLFSPEEWEIVLSLSPLPATAPPNPTNHVADNPAAAKLGQMLFFDFRFSKEGTIACSTCHSPFYAFADIEATSLATGRGTRNTPTIFNAVFNEWQFWDGRAESMWAVSLLAFEDESEMAGTRTQYAHIINEYYKTLYEEIFGPLPELDDTSRFPKEGKPGDPAFDNMSEADQIIINTIFANMGKAVDAYQRLLITSAAPFDNYVAGNEDAISLAAKRGLKLFVGKARCVDCHSTPRFTDNRFYNIGVATTEDTGRFDGIPLLLDNIFNSSNIYSDSRGESESILSMLEAKPEDKGAFRTPPLRNVAITAPYFHAGQLLDLESVIKFKNAGGYTTAYPGRAPEIIETLDLTEQEQADLIEFLHTLTGEPPPAVLMHRLVDAP